MGKIDFYDQMQGVFKDIQENATDAAEKATKKAVRKARKLLKQNSPKRKGGRYAAGWTIKTEKTRLSTSMTIYNAKYPGLTHLLENGHVSRNQYGEYGRVSPKPHIENAEQAGIEEMEKAITQELNKAL